jgi:hypothetical protein
MPPAGAQTLVGGGDLFKLVALRAPVDNRNALGLWRDSWKTQLGSSGNAGTSLLAAVSKKPASNLSQKTVVGQGEDEEIVFCRNQSSSYGCRTK